MSDALRPLVQHGRAVFGDTWSPHRVATAPGRLELLGNHVDYNGGLVLAGAIDRTITAIAAPAQEARDTFSLAAPDVLNALYEIAADQPHPAPADEATSPGDYLAGIIRALYETGVPFRRGLDILVSGTIPVGFGMSSSAALCVSLTLLLAGPELAPADIVAIARRAEHITGAPVGAMDQSASVAGGVILFNGATGEIDKLEPDLGDHVFAVASSGVHHALGQSAYPARVRESNEALALIRRHIDPGVGHLGEIAPDAWDTILSRDPGWLSPLLRRRVQHVVSEVERVRQGVRAIEARDWNRFGQLMTASGRSSAQNYEISHPVVEELVRELNGMPGVRGARMMGGGEGGPALALLHRDAVPAVRDALGAGFFARHNLDADAAFEVCTFGPGASVK